MIVNTDYPEFLNWLYSHQPGLGELPFDEQMRARAESLFGVADFYSRNLRELGHEAIDVYANNEYLQRAWAREHGARVKGHAVAKRVVQYARQTPARALSRHLKPLFHPIIRSFEAWFYEILAAQIKYYNVDVLLNQAMFSIRSTFLKTIKPNVSLIVGQIASPLPIDEDFRCYDLIISSLPNVVEYFRVMGKAAEIHLLGFEPRILSRLSTKEKEIPVSFVGSLSPQHKNRMNLLEFLCSQINVQLWCGMAGALRSDSSIRRNYRGRAWGLEMYQILQDSRVTLNSHIDMAESYANNLRLFEATGVGTTLITDWKVNLHQMFELGKEVVTYRSPHECLELIKYYLEHDEEREAIARAGQERTLREHTYKRRMRELLNIVSRYM
jgi:spore maturation protein CgeB